MRATTKPKRIGGPVGLLLGCAFAISVVPVAAGDDDHKHAAKKKCSAAISECVHGMASKLEGRGWIGIEWEQEDGRPLLTQVVSDSPGEKAGLLKGDVIVAFNGVATDSGEDAVYAEVKRSLVAGNTIRLEISRDGAKKTVPVTLVPLPRQVMAQWIGNHVLENHAEAEEDAESPRP